MWGMTVEEARVPPLDVWPDNWPAACAYASMSTQWRIAMGGATGLDYVALESVFRMAGVPRKDWPEMLADIRTMERVTLLDIQQKREQAEREEKRQQR
jgi:hypothetical protein